MKRREFITLLGSTTHCISDESAPNVSFCLSRGSVSTTGNKADLLE
jgi:hypothetical protein